MKVLTGVIVAFAFVGFVAFAWQNILEPCGQPVRYSVGSLDPRFGISQEELLADIARAEQVWEAALGKELFLYDPRASFTINLVFDERQEQTLASKKLDQVLGDTQARQEGLVEQNTRMRARYDVALREYERALEDFKQRLSAYNRKVDDWNKRGGAPSQEYQKLEEEAQALQDREKKLEGKRVAVNNLADQINKFSKEQIRAVEAYNSQVDQFRERYGESQDFDQGYYVGTAINIYQFEDRSRLRLVLAHELGHALGIGHVNDPRALMYYLLEVQNPDALTLQPDDQRALASACTVTLESLMRPFRTFSL